MGTTPKNDTDRAMRWALIIGIIALVMCPCFIVWGVRGHIEGSAHRERTLAMLDKYLRDANSDSRINSSTQEGLSKKQDVSYVSNMTVIGLVSYQRHFSPLLERGVVGLAFGVIGLAMLSVRRKYGQLLSLQASAASTGATKQE